MFEGSAFGFTALTTLHIVPVDNGSKFEIYHGRPYEEFGPDDIILQKKLANTAAAAFAEVIADEIQTGRVEPDQVEVNKAPKKVFGRSNLAAVRFASILFKDHR